MKILVIQQKMIGDVLASTIICQNLKLIYPTANIHYLANSNTLAVLENNPYIDKAIPFLKEYQNNKKVLLNFLRTIKKQEYDIVIDAYGKLESNLISFFSKAEIKISKYKWYTSWIYTETVKEDLGFGPAFPLAYKNRNKLLQSLNKNHVALINRPTLHLSESERLLAQNLKKDLLGKLYTTLIMVSILGSDQLKTYPAKYMASILDEICIVTKNACLLLNFMPEEKDKVLKVYNLCNEHTKTRINLGYSASSLRDLIIILSVCDAVIGNEGGVINMAKALNISTFAIFSPWIRKDAWHIDIEDREIAVHLKDYFPQYYANKTEKELKKYTKKKYGDFIPALFLEKLKKFIKTNGL